MNGRHSDPWPKPAGTYRPHVCPPNHEGWWAAVGLASGFLLGVLATVLLVTW
jgi:hypothetical protein